MAVFALYQPAVCQQYLSYQKGFTLGGPAFETSGATTEDTQGNIYVAGGFSDSMDADPGVQEQWLKTFSGYSGYILKLNPQGQLEWAYGVAVYCADLQLNSNGDLLIAGIYRDSTDFDPGPGTFNLYHNTAHYAHFLLNLSSSGGFNWVKHTGAGSIMIHENSMKLKVDQDQNIILAGELNGSYDFDPGPGVHNLSSSGATDFFIQKLNSSGNLIWAYSFGDAANDEIYGLSVDDHGNITCGGKFGGIVDFDPGPGWALKTATGNSWDAYVFKLTPNGDLDWVTTFGNEKWAEIRSVASDSLGNIYFSGQFRDTINLDPSSNQFILNGFKKANLLIAKLSAQGDYMWARQFGNEEKDEYLSEVIVDHEGNPVMMGHIYVGLDLDPGPDTFYLSGTSDIFLLRLTPTGNFKGGAALEGVGTIRFKDLRAGTNNTLILSGSFWNQIDLDPGPGDLSHTCKGTEDPFTVFLTQAYINDLIGKERENSLVVYPNPSSGMIQVTSDMEISQLELFDLNGIKLLESRDEQLDLAGLSNGLYLVRITDNSGRKYSKKILKN